MVVGYEWGSLNHLKPNDHSPDHHANSDIGSTLRDYAGSFTNEKNYDCKRTELVMILDSFLM